MPTKDDNGFNLALAGMTDVNISEDGENHNEPCWGVDLSDVKFYWDQEMTFEADIESIPKNVIEAITGCVPIIRCRDCKHRPVVTKSGIDQVCRVEAPKIRIQENNGSVTEDEDLTCPFLNPDDPWYNGTPSDDFFCKNGDWNKH
jgi:hypothetical protein